MKNAINCLSLKQRKDTYKTTSQGVHWGQAPNCEVVSLFFLLAIVIGLLFILTRIAQYFRRHRSRFPHASYVLWRRSYHMFIIISLTFLGYLLVSLQLLNQYK